MIHLDIHGRQVPALGFGTAGLLGDVCVDGVRDAIDIGYRHIDTARAYRNEADVGKGIAASGVPRDELFVTTKIRGEDLRPEKVGPATEESRERLGLDAIDLLLIHSPSRDVPLKETLDAMVEQRDKGTIRHIGVSNFRTSLLEEAMAITEIFADQVPYQPGRTQRGLCQVAKEKGVMLTAYSPLRGRGLGDPTVEEIAKRHGKSAPQVVLRWLLQQPNVNPIPRSSSSDHRRANFDVFDFELTAEEMAAIHGLAEEPTGS